MHRSTIFRLATRGNYTRVPLVQDTVVPAEKLRRILWRMGMDRTHRGGWNCTKTLAWPACPGKTNRPPTAAAPASALTSFRRRITPCLHRACLVPPRQNNHDELSSKVPLTPPPSRLRPGYKGGTHAHPAPRPTEFARHSPELRRHGAENRGGCPAAARSSPQAPVDEGRAAAAAAACGYDSRGQRGKELPVSAEISGAAAGRGLPFVVQQRVRQAGGGVLLWRAPSSDDTGAREGRYVRGGVVWAWRSEGLLKRVPKRKYGNIRSTATSAVRGKTKAMAPSLWASC